MLKNLSTTYDLKSAVKKVRPIKPGDFNPPTIDEIIKTRRLRSKLQETTKFF